METQKFSLFMPEWGDDTITGFTLAEDHLHLLDFARWRQRIQLRSDSDSEHSGLCIVRRSDGNDYVLGRLDRSSGSEKGPEHRCCCTGELIW